jgi:hypothetical protein
LRVGSPSQSSHPSILPLALPVAPNNSTNTHKNTGYHFFSVKHSSTEMSNPNNNQRDQQQQDYEQAWSCWDQLPRGRGRPVSFDNDVVLSLSVLQGRSATSTLQGDTMPQRHVGLRATRPLTSLSFRHRMDRADMAARLVATVDAALALANDDIKLDDEPFLE